MWPWTINFGSPQMLSLDRFPENKPKAIIPRQAKGSASGLLVSIIGYRSYTVLVLFGG
jgi:hypothetical protein